MIRGNNVTVHHPELMYSEENATEFRGALSKEPSFWVSPFLGEQLTILYIWASVDYTLN